MSTVGKWKKNIVCVAKAFKAEFENAVNKIMLENVNAKIEATLIEKHLYKAIISFDVFIEDEK